MNEIDPVVWAVIAYILGVGLRVMWPYLMAYLQDGVAFDVRYVVSQIVSALIGVVPILAFSDLVEQLSALGWLAAFGMGYGWAELGREAQKTVKALRTVRARKVAQ